MPRPFCPRKLNACPIVEQFVPVIDGERKNNDTEPVTLTLDEFEALRLADYMGLYHEEAGQQMGVSRPTFSRIIEQARRKLSKALVEGIPIYINGGSVNFVCQRRMHGRERHCHRNCRRQNYVHEMKYEKGNYNNRP